MARPTKYNKEIIEKTEHYLEHFEDYGDVIPSIVGLSLVIDISRETIHTWAKEKGKEKFSDILEKINARQQQVLISKGLTNQFNSNITKLVLGKHGYSDKQELTGKDGDPIEIDTQFTVEVVDP